VIGISDRRVRLVTVAIEVAGLIAAATQPAGAQDISVNFAQGSGLMTCIEWSKWNVS
jgi:hypothetical protein